MTAAAPTISAQIGISAFKKRTKSFRLLPDSGCNPSRAKGACTACCANTARKALNSRSRIGLGKRAAVEMPYPPVVSSAGSPAASLPGTSGMTGDGKRVLMQTKAV